MDPSPPSTQPRVERLLAELRARYELEDSFATQLRPLIEKILAPGIPETRRATLLESLAQTCQDDLAFRRRFAALDTALGDLVQRLRQMGSWLAASARAAEKAADQPARGVDESTSA